MAVAQSCLAVTGSARYPLLGTSGARALPLGVRASFFATQVSMERLHEWLRCSSVGVWARLCAMPCVGVPSQQWGSASHTRTHPNCSHTHPTALRIHEFTTAMHLDDIALTTLAYTLGAENGSLEDNHSHRRSVSLFAAGQHLSAERRSSLCPMLSVSQPSLRLLLASSRTRRRSGARGHTFIGEERQ